HYAVGSGHRLHSRPSGHSIGKPPHLHYAVIALLPYLWRWSDEPQGWKKLFMLDPGQLLDASKTPPSGNANPGGFLNRPRSTMMRL
ncbi:MAG: hypothetical protein ACREEE_07710, partial [Dongiaceae bacterium]